MPQKGQFPSGSLVITTTATEFRDEGCRIQAIRQDIWIGLLPEAEATRVPLYVQSGEAVLVIAFLVPRTGKGGEDNLPAGSLSMLPPGRNPLPPLPGRGILLCITAPRLTAILGPEDRKSTRLNSSH